MRPRTLLLCSVSVVLVGGVAVAKKKRAKKGPAVPSSGWEVLVTAGTRMALFSEMPEAGSAPYQLEVGDVKTAGEVTTACLMSGDLCAVPVAVGPAGVWIGGDGTGEPTFRFGERGWTDKKEDTYLEVASDGEVCFGWSNTKYECEDVCFFRTCVAPGQGIVELSGQSSPDAMTWRADDPLCVAADAETRWIEVTGTTATACVGDRCRKVDLATGSWSPDEMPFATVSASDAPPAYTGAVPGLIGSIGFSAVSGDGALAAVAITDEAGKTEIVTIDVAASAVLARKAVPADTYVGDLRFAEGNLLVRTAACAGPCDQYDLYEPRKLGHRGKIGGKQPIEGGPPPVQIKGSLYAFVDGWGAEVALVDLKKGKLKKRTRLDKFAPQLGPDASVRKVDAGIAILYSPLVTADGRGGVAVVSPKGKLLRHAGLPACADPSAGKE